MPVMGEAGNIVRSMGLYLFGRGLVSLGVIAATMASTAFSGFTILGAAPALVLALGGVALTGFMRLRAQAHYETNMVNLYRDDIANQLGIAPEEVTRANLKEAAKSNDVIAQALHRQERKNVVAFSTAALAGLTTFGLITFAVAPNILTHFLTESLSLGSTAAKVLSFASAGIVAGLSSLVVHDGLEAAIGRGTGLSKAAAHDLIYAMHRDVAQNRVISPERIYGVMVAGDPALGNAIHQQFKKHYADMSTHEQRTVLKTIGVVNEMEKLAYGVSTGRIAPGHLAFIIDDARKFDAPASSPTADMDHAPSMARGHFVDKLNLAPRAQASFAERVSITRSDGAPAL